MRILVIWSDFPSPYCGCSLPAFHIMKHLSAKHELTLMSFRDTLDEERYTDDLQNYCCDLKVFNLQMQKSIFKLAVQAAKNTLSLHNLFSKRPALLSSSYSPSMQSEVNHTLTIKSFDLIYTDLSMAHYVQDVSLPKIIHELDCETEMIRQWSVNANNPGEKLLRWIQYVKAKRYESNILRKFDASIVLSTYDQDILNSLCPEANMVLIPLGVDTDFFEPLAEEEEWPSLAFVGDMNHPPNIDAILFFYDNIYGKIKETLSETKLYIVGRNPTKEIYNLSSDESVTVTGYVEDVRPYLARSSVSIAPFVSGTGIKNKILEAMAMGKAVVSTSIGCRGINVSPNEDIIVADDPKEYADEVIRLLTNTSLRKNMGHNARKSMKVNYSWDKIAEQFDILFNQVVHK